MCPQRPHSDPLFAASGARAAADIFAIFFHTPPPSHKATNHAPGSRCTFHSPFLPPILYLVAIRITSSADKPQHIDQRPGMRHRRIARSGSDPDRQLAPDPVLFLFILGTCSFFTHFPQSGTLARQRIRVPSHGSFPQFPHIIHTQRPPRRHKKNPGSLILPGFHLWSKWRDSNPRPFGPEPVTH